MFILIFFLHFTKIQAENWAILAAGSIGFYNYRHQSDVCHIYQTLIRNGFNPKNIITMAYDDIAFDKQNRFQGALYNNPSWDGFPENVYSGCLINYKKKDVNPLNFINLLLGNKDYVPQGFPVLESNQEDNIFIYFSDHGAPGLIAFPFANLYKDELIDTITQMKEKQMYNKLIFFLETCEAGSMFENLNQNLNVYALTASNETESSYGTYCPLEDLVNGYRIGTCLADEFSANFIEHLDFGQSIQNMTLFDQYQIVKQKTTSSHVKQWGDLSFQNDPLKLYFFDSFKTNIQDNKVINFKKNQFQNWNSRDVKLLYLFQIYIKNDSLRNFKDLLYEIHERQKFDKIFLELQMKFNLQGNYYGSENINCTKKLINLFEINCQKFSDYGLKYIKYLNEICINKLEVEKQFKQTLQKCD